MFGLLKSKMASRETTAETCAVAPSVASLSRDLSIEVSPKEALRGAKGLDAVPLGTRTFITRLPKGSFEETLAASARLSELGLRPIPHLTARTTPDARTLAARLKELVDIAGVEEILLIAGSNDRPEGKFSNTLEILESGVIEDSGLNALNLAGHPEGHPQAIQSELDRALDLKNAFAERAGIPTVLVTQFFFDAAPVVAWERRLRQRGNRLPIDPGLHGVTGITSLMKHAIACGVGPSIKVLGNHSGNLLQFAQVRSPGGILGGIAAAQAADENCLFRNIHLFPLGGFERTVSWANNLQQGHFSVQANGEIVVRE
jgi:methylenetetrahydrofolate reductase (NADPH)